MKSTCGTMLALVALAAPALRSAPVTPPARPATAAPARPIVILADLLEYDEPRSEYRLTGNVDLTTHQLHLKSNSMVVTVNKKRELQTANCTGSVVIEKTQDDGVRLEARSDTLVYQEAAQSAVLEGNVDVSQSSEKLAKPARVLGRRVEMDLKSGLNKVFGAPGKPAHVHVEPKGEMGKPTPEPVDLIGGRIEMNQRTQQYLAVEAPEFRRVNSWLKATTIRFELDPKGSEVKGAHAVGNVSVYQKNPKGTVLNATAQKGTYLQETGVLELEGQVDARVTEQGQEQPQIYQGEVFLYNERTGYHRLTKAKVTLPGNPTAQPNP